MRALTLLLLTSCAVLGPEITQWGNHPMAEVPAEYAAWYAATEACWGERGDFGAVEWWVADKVRHGDVWARGMIQGDRITMTLGYHEIERYVRHEMSHHVSGIMDGIHYTDENGRHRAVCDED